MSARRIGIVGGGQLARMLALAGVPLGFEFSVLDPAADACAGAVARLIRAGYDDPAGLDELAENDLITFDFENVPEAAARRLAGRRPVYPPPDALAAAQDRLVEKNLFRELGMHTAPFAPVDGPADLVKAAAQTGLPAILKTRRLGYDGKGQQAVADGAVLEQLAAGPDDGAPRILEGRVNFERELSLLAARGRDGAVAFYPLIENTHRDGILRVSRAPYHDPGLTRRAQRYGRALLERLDYVGLLAVEFFLVDGELLGNEMAPRVHNSGHWTIEGAETSQFENHLRAVAGLPLGSTAARGYSAMLNFIGTLPPPEPYLRCPGGHFHGYGKAPRPGRKVGHATVRADSAVELERRLAALPADV